MSKVACTTSCLASKSEFQHAWCVRVRASLNSSCNCTAAWQYSWIGEHLLSLLSNCPMSPTKMSPIMLSILSLSCRHTMTYSFFSFLQASRLLRSAAPTCYHWGTRMWKASLQSANLNFHLKLFLQLNEHVVYYNHSKIQKRMTRTETGNEHNMHLNPPLSRQRKSTHKHTIQQHIFLPEKICPEFQSKQAQPVHPGAPEMTSLRLVQFSTPTRQHLRARQHTRCCWKHRWIHWPGRIWGYFTRHSTLKFESCYTVVSNVSKPFSQVRLQETHHGAESHGTFIRLLHHLWHLVAPLVSMASLILMADSWCCS